MNAPVNLEKHLIEVPPVAWSRTTMTQVVGISLTEVERLAAEQERARLEQKRRIGFGKFAKSVVRESQFFGE